MLAHAKAMMEYHNGQVAINPKHNKLVTVLRMAVENGEGSLDKEATSHDDLFDSFRLSLMFQRYLDKELSGSEWVMAFALAIPAFAIQVVVFETS